LFIFGYELKIPDHDNYQSLLFQNSLNSRRIRVSPAKGYGFFIEIS